MHYKFPFYLHTYAAIGKQTVARFTHKSLVTALRIMSLCGVK